MTLGMALAAPLLAQQAQSGPAGENRLMQSAKEAEENRDFKRAASIYEQILKDHPRQPDVLEHLGLVYYLSGQFSQAIPVLKEAARLDPTLWGSYLFLGISDYRSGDFAGAAAALRRAMALKPDLPEAQYWYGSTLMAQNQPEAAIPYLQRAGKNARTELDAESLLAQAYEASAELYNQQIVRSQPDSYRAHQLKAESLAWQGRDSAALLEYQRALEKKPDLEGVHSAMGAIYWGERHFDLAARQFEAEIKLDPMDYLSNLRLGEYSLANGKADTAQGYLLRAAPADKTGEAWHFLGIAAINLKQAETAIHDFQRAARLSPDDPSNHQYLMNLYRQTGCLSQAETERSTLQNLEKSTK